MYKKQRRIPTILGLTIIFFGLATAIYLDTQETSTLTQASSVNAPEDIHITNVSDSVMSVSWFTKDPSIGLVSVERSGRNEVYFDDLDSESNVTEKTAHHVTIRNLEPETTYAVTIISGGDTCQDKSSTCVTIDQKTGMKIEQTSNPPPIKGSATQISGNPAVGSVVYVTIENSFPLSGIVDSSGLWVIPLANLRSNDLLSRPQLEDTDLINVLVKRSPSETATAVTDVKSVRQNLNIPNLQLGNAYNFINLASKKSLVANLPGANILGFQVGKTPLSSESSRVQDFLNVQFPQADNDTTPDTQPRIRGTAKPGKELLITVNSTPQTGKVTVEEDGSWVWRPPKKLEPGIHTLTIQSYDENGNVSTVTRKFIVLKSGESVLGDSTPSASLTPTFALTPTLAFTPTPTLLLISPTEIPDITSSPYPTSVYASSTPSVTPPRAGEMGETYVLLAGSTALLIIGIKLLAFS